MKKKITIFLLAAILIVGLSFGSYVIAQSIDIPNLGDTLSPEARQRTAERILKDTGEDKTYTADDVRDINVYYGNLDSQNGEDVVIAVEFGPTDTLVVAYKSTGDGNYEYLGTIGTFFTVDDIYMDPAGSLDRDVVVILERANQRIGAFETSTHIRGFLWNGNTFDDILRIEESIKSEWNRLWDRPDKTGPSQWERVLMTSEVAVDEDNPNNIINQIQYQRLQTSSDTVTRAVPEDDTYKTIEERVVSIRYYWSEEWRRFIIKEMIEKSTGEKVAVIADNANSPYVLVPEFREYANRYQIVRKDGTVDIVNKDLLAPVE